MAYLDRLKALFVASGRDEAEGVLFRVVLGAESVAPTLPPSRAAARTRASRRRKSKAVAGGQGPAVVD